MSIDSRVTIIDSILWGNTDPEIGVFSGNDPAVSSPTGDPASNRYAMFVWSNHDVQVRVVDYNGTALTPVTNMSLLEEQAGRLGIDRQQLICTLDGAVGGQTSLVRSL